jgi:hypothetical protein
MAIPCDVGSRHVTKTIAETQSKNRSLGVFGRARRPCCRVTLTGDHRWQSYPAPAASGRLTRR